MVSETLNALRSRELIYRREESTFVDAREYIFKHDLLREVTYESVLKRLRGVYHGLVAEWLIEHSAERIGEYSGLIAQHLLLAGKDNQALQFFIRAGEAALASYANAEAERYFRQALALSPTQSEQAALLSGLGEALGRQARSEEAVETYRQGIELYKTLGNSDSIAELYARSSRVVWYRGDHSGSWSLCQEGLTQLEGCSDSLGLARLLAEAGRAAYFSGVGNEVQPFCKRAIDMAERLGDVEVGSEARMTLAYLSYDTEKSVDILGEVASLAEANGLLMTASRAHNNLGAWLTKLGEIASAHQHYLRSAEIARWIGNASHLVLSLGNASYTACLQGELQEVEQILSEIEHIQSITPGSWSQFHHLARRAHLNLSRGEWKRALELIRTVLVEARSGGDLQTQLYGVSYLTEITLELNRFIGYNDWTWIESELEDALDVPLKLISSIHPYYLLAVVRARQGCLTEAHHMYMEEGRLFAREESPGDLLQRLSTEYELAYAEGHWKEAIAAGESLIATCEITDCHWLQARGLIDLADALRQRRGPDDLERARHAYQKSLDMFTKMGAPGYVRVLKERLKTSWSKPGD
jgi:tetratricopeptide (TPR) repeat protein